MAICVENVSDEPFTLWTLLLNSLCINSLMNDMNAYTFSPGMG